VQLQILYYRVATTLQLNDLVCVMWLSVMLHSLPTTLPPSATSSSSVLKKSPFVSVNPYIQDVPKVLVYGHLRRVRTFGTPCSRSQQSSQPLSVMTRLWRRPQPPRVTDAIIPPYSSLVLFDRVSCGRKENDHCYKHPQWRRGQEQRRSSSFGTPQRALPIG
jgi:hypothetical protein